MITAIITQLKTGTYTNVYARADGVVNPAIPYIMVWEDSKIGPNGGIFISLHTVPAMTDSLDLYMKNELITLLHKVILTDTYGNNFRLIDTGELSKVIDNNDDGSISRDRLFLLPTVEVI